MRGSAPIALAATLALALVAMPSPARAADECQGLLVCIPVAGPWVVVPASSDAIATASWRLECPEGVVGGTDARVSERAVAVDFPARVGSPVGPGVSTTDAATFTGRYAGRTRNRATSFRPYLGCIPGGGGRRTPTSAPSEGPVARQAATAVRPGEPVVVRVETLRVGVGQLARASLGCRSGERLLRASHAIGLRTRSVPTVAQLQAVRVVRVVRAGRVLASATRRGLADTIVAEVQLRAECGRR